MLEPVHPANSISATSLGCSQRTFFSCLGALSPPNGLFLRVSALSRGNSLAGTSRPYPPPTRSERRLPQWSIRLSRLHGRHGIWTSPTHRSCLTCTERRGVWRLCPPAPFCRPIATRCRRAIRNAPRTEFGRRRRRSGAVARAAPYDRSAVVVEGLHGPRTKDRKRRKSDV